MYILKKLQTTDIFTWKLGLIRGLLSLSLLVTLLFNDPTVLFNEKALASATSVVSIKSYTIFSLLNFETAIFVSIVILFFVIVGILPQLIGILHWWVSASYMIDAQYINGGDQVHALLSFLLIPICLSDPRLNHWRKNKFQQNKYRNFLANISSIVISIQMSIIYLHAAIGKLQEDDWLDGTAYYYWTSNSFFGAPPSLENVMHFISKYPIVTISFTWGTILIELLLAGGIIIQKRFKRHLLIAGIIFHLAILFQIGLFSFSLVMISGLFLYLGNLTLEK